MSKRNGEVAPNIALNLVEKYIKMGFLAYTGTKAPRIPRQFSTYDNK